MKPILQICVPLIAVLSLSHAVRAQVSSDVAPFVEARWDQDDPGVWSRSSGADGPEPIVDSGNLILSMEGATGGATFVRKVLTLPKDFVLTVRVAVEKFPDISGDFGTSPAGRKGICLVDAMQDDQLVVLVGPSEINVANWSNGNRGTTIPVDTEPGVFYTWQFDVRQAPGDAGGTVTIRRKQEDSAPWEQVGGENIPILNQDFGDQILMGAVPYNADNPDSQGILRQEYFLAEGAAAEPPNP